MKNTNSKLQSSKLFQLLNSIEQKKHKKVGKFLASPYFNIPKYVEECFSVITQLSTRKREALTKEKLHQKIYPKLLYKDERLRLVMSQLVQALEQYLLLEEKQYNRSSQKIHLAEWYQKRQSRKLYEQASTTAHQQLQKEPFRNANFYRQSYQLSLADYQYASSANRTSPQNLQTVANLLDTAYIIEKLKVACLMVAHQRVYQQSYDFGLLEIILAYIQQKDLTTIPAIGVYFHGYHALSKDASTQHFQQFKNLLFQYQQQFNQTELMDLYFLGINCCIRMINQGNLSFFEEAMLLYQRGLETNALLENGILSRFTYQNIVSTGLRTKQYEWTDSFIENYKSKVEKAYQESAYRFNKGRLAYDQKQYEEALDLLKDTDHKDLLINLFSKTLLLKIYYELEEFKLLGAFLDSFQIYLRRKKVIGYHKENYQKIIYYTQQLMKVNPYDKEKKTLLKQKISEDEGLLEKEWLLGQLERLQA